MPWMEVNPMDAKVLFVSDYMRHINSFSGLCRAHGISRKTGYKWIKRYKESGLDGLSDQSRRPHTHPYKIPHRIRQKIIELRKKYKYWGAKKIREVLITGHPTWDSPSETTIYNIIKAEGMILSRKRRHRVARTSAKLPKARRPNELWTADFKGQFLTGEGKWCYPLTIMDHASRYLLACDIVPGTRYEDTQFGGHHTKLIDFLRDHQRKVTKETRPVRCGRLPDSSGFRGAGKNSLAELVFRGRWLRYRLFQPADSLVLIRPNSFPA